MTRGRRSGVLYALAASLSSTASSVLVKTSPVPVGQITFLSGLTLATAGLALAASRSEPLVPRPGVRAVSALFALLTVTVLLADSHALRLMPLADQVLLSYTSIVFTLILAKLILKERLGFWKVAGSVVVLSGASLISETAYPAYKLGCLLTLSGAFLDAATYVLMKELIESQELSGLLLATGSAALVLTGPLMAVEDWRCPREPAALAGIVLLNLSQEALLYLALDRGEEASLVSLLQATDIIFSYVLQVTLYNEPGGACQLLGSCLVLCGVSIGALAAGRPEEATIPAEDAEEDLLLAVLQEEDEGQCRPGSIQP